MKISRVTTKDCCKTSKACNCYSLADHGSRTTRAFAHRFNHIQRSGWLTGALSFLPVLRTLPLLFLSVALSLGGVLIGGAVYSQVIYVEDPKTQYTRQTPQDAVTRLQNDIDSGKVKFSFDPKFGYLPSLLKELKVSPTSQVVVFSKTSVQKELISPETPRALYFNDTTYVGFVPSAKALELCTSDPYLGAVYYTMLQREVAKPRFFRSIDACLECHGDKAMKHLPAHIMYSTRCTPDGVPVPGLSPEPVTDQTPLAQRFGGWFVTGDIGNQTHSGNSFEPVPGQAVSIDKRPPGPITDLSMLTDATQLYRSKSDIVALMTFTHQYHLQNLIAEATYQVNSALAFERLYPERAVARVDSEGHTETTEQTIRRVGEPIVSGLLFCGEAKLTGRLRGDSGYEQYFSQIGPKDRAGRSLRTFDLVHRLFRYPCSYTIYTDNFDGLPPPAKRYVYRRLWEVLIGHDNNARFAQLSAADRKAILEILCATKPGFISARPGRISRK